jgi:hypothetical protein
MGVWQRSRTVTSCLKRRLRLAYLDSVLCMLLNWDQCHQNSRNHHHHRGLGMASGPMSQLLWRICQDTPTHSVYSFLLLVVTNQNRLIATAGVGYYRLHQLTYLIYSSRQCRAQPVRLLQHISWQVDLGRSIPLLFESLGVVPCQAHDGQVHLFASMGPAVRQLVPDSHPNDCAAGFPVK